MIQARDEIELAPGVRLRGESIVDPVRRSAVPLNATARLVVAARTVEGAAAELTAAGASDGSRDALAFCGELNARGLLNVRIPLVARVLRRLAAIRYGLVLHAPVRRIDVSGPLTVAGAVAKPAAVLSLALLPVATFAGVAAVAAAVATGAAVVLHEVGHALALRRLPYALLLDGLRPELIHPRLSGRRAAVVAAAGPLLPALSAVALTLAVRPLAPVVAPMAAHALALSVLADDGRNACGLS